MSEEKSFTPIHDVVIEEVDSVESTIPDRKTSPTEEIADGDEEKISIKDSTDDDDDDDDDDEIVVGATLDTAQGTAGTTVGKAKVGSDDESDEEEAFRFLQWVVQQKLVLYASKGAPRHDSYEFAGKHMMHDMITTLSRIRYGQKDPNITGPEVLNLLHDVMEFLIRSFAYTECKTKTMNDNKSCKIPPAKLNVHHSTEGVLVSHYETRKKEKANDRGIPESLYDTWTKMATKEKDDHKDVKSVYTNSYAHTFLKDNDKNLHLPVGKENYITFYEKRLNKLGFTAVTAQNKGQSKLARNNSATASSKSNKKNGSGDTRKPPPPPPPPPAIKGRQQYPRESRSNGNGAGTTPSKETKRDFTHCMNRSGSPVTSILKMGTPTLKRKKGSGSNDGSTEKRRKVVINDQVAQAEKQAKKEKNLISMMAERTENDDMAINSLISVFNRTMTDSMTVIFKRMKKAGLYIDTAPPECHPHHLKLYNAYIRDLVEQGVDDNTREAFLHAFNVHDDDCLFVFYKKDT